MGTTLILDPAVAAWLERVRESALLLLARFPCYDRQNPVRWKRNPVNDLREVSGKALKRLMD
jgi:hypothetical protein